MQHFTVFVIGGDDDESGIISILETGDICRLRFTFRGQIVEAEASDYFEAFCKIRLELEKEKIIPFCYGASLNVYPSGMARDMGKGLKAYRMTIGKDARTEDVVDIFADGPDVIPAYVKLQRDYWHEWRESVAKP
jgi:hypothetical protein